MFSQGWGGAVIGGGSGGWSAPSAPAAAPSGAGWSTAGAGASAPASGSGWSFAPAAAPSAPPAAAPAYSPGYTLPGGPGAPYAPPPGISGPLTVGPYGEGVYTPLDYPAMRFLGEGQSLEMTTEAQRAKSNLCLVVGVIALLALLK